MDKNDVGGIIANLINSMNREDGIFKEIKYRAMDLAVIPIKLLDAKIIRLPDEREQLIKTVRSNWNQRYEQLINSGLKITADEKQQHNSDTISHWMFDNASYKIPFPDECQPTDQNIEPKEWIIQAVTPIFEANHVIFVCNYMLNEETNLSEGEKGRYTEFTSKTFKIDCKPERLNIIRERLIEKKIIKNISKDDFAYLFTGQPITQEMKSIIWIETRPLGHEFLRRFIYRNNQFNFKLVNECIKYLDGKKLNAGCKSTAQYKNDRLNPILDPIPEV